MIIHSGLLKKTKINLPRSCFGVRPTSSKIRESVFNILDAFIEDSVFFDLFCGSGAMGIQAISLGAYRSIFIDNNRNLINNIRKYLNKHGYIHKAEFNISDALKFLNAFKSSLSSKFSIAYIDPPYDYGHWPLLLSILDDFKFPFDLVSIESDKNLKDYIEKLKIFDMYKYKKYSEKQIYILRKK